MRSVVEFFARRHLLGNVVTVLALVWGLIAALTIRKDLFPQVEFDTTLIVAVLPGAAPEQVERLLLNPIEEALREVDGIKRVQSSASDSRVVVTVVLDPDARNTEKTNDDIRRAVDRLEDYPAEAEKPIVTALESGQTPVVELAISSTEIPPLELRDWTRKIADELTFVPGVAKVTKVAWQKREIVVDVHASRLVRNEVALNQIVGALKSTNVQLPGGDFLLPTGKEVSVKTDGEFRTKKDIENTAIRNNFEGFGVQIKDIATVRDGVEKPDQLSRVNGIKSFSLIIAKKSKADAIKTLAAVKERMQQLETRFPAKLEYRFVNDFTFYLRNRIGILSSNMAMGIVLIIGTLAFFFPFRVALVVGMGVPFSMLLGIAILKQMGFSLNLVSMIGLIIVSGMLVDDAIVVVENIFRRLENGDPFDVAIIDGTSEIFPAVTASVLTTVAAFSPMLFMTGIFGKFIFEIPVMVIIPLVVSLFEAMIIAPGHFYSWVGRNAFAVIQAKQKKEGHTHWYHRFAARYRRLLNVTLVHKWKTGFVFVCLVIATGIATTRMKFILFPPDGIYSFFVRMEGDPGITLLEMEKRVSQIEERIRELPGQELKDFVTKIGIHQNDPNDPFTKRASHYAQIIVNLTPQTDRDRTVDEVVIDLREKIKAPRGINRLNFEVAKGGPPQGKPITINIRGDKFEDLRKIADRIKEVLGTVEGVTDIEDSEVVGKREVRILPEQTDVQRLGLTVQEVATTVRAAFSGIVATSIRNLEEEINIRVQMKPELKEAADQLANLKIGNQQGNLIPLNRLSKFEEGPSRLLIQHYKYKRVISVGAQVDLGKTTALAATAQAQAKLKDLGKEFPEYVIEYAGENEDTAESMQSLGRAFGMAAIIILSILILTFGSLAQPVLVLFAIPLGFVGTIFGLILHGKPISFMAILGMIALAGVIVNNAIIMIDFFNLERAGGKNLSEAVLNAATTRLRPILLTSATTVMGLMPTAYGIGGYDGFVATLALALGWGLFMGSVLTLLFFPALLLILESIKARVMGSSSHVS